MKRDLSGAPKEHDIPSPLTLDVQQCRLTRTPEDPSSGLRLPFETGKGVWGRHTQVGRAETEENEVRSSPLGRREVVGVQVPRGETEVGWTSGRPLVR